MGQTFTTRPTTLLHPTCFEIAAPITPADARRSAALRLSSFGSRFRSLQVEREQRRAAFLPGERR